MARTKDSKSGAAAKGRKEAKPEKESAAAAPEEQVEAVEEDTTMDDATGAPAEAAALGELSANHDEVLAALDSVQNIRVLPGSSDTAASFEFTGEDHTLGNALRYIIMKKYVCPGTFGGF
jgi:DNA-directed RNA polymerase I and III subunit RPAC2